MKKLVVIYRGWGQRQVLGHLGDDGSNVLFEFSPETLRDGPDLSPLMLPLRAQGYGQLPAHQSGLPGIIADALPDGWGMLLMDRLFRKRGLDVARLSPLDRLAFIGDAAIGALSFEPPQGERLEPAAVQLLDLAREVRDVQEPTAEKAESLLLHLALLGGSPHGVRPKVLVQFDAVSGRMSNSEHAAGAPWLVKFPARGEHGEVSAVEAFYAALADACGIEIPPTRYFGLGRGLTAFGIERFDRNAGMRVPTHTAAGALHIDFRIPSMDYTTLLRLVRFMTRDEREVLKTFERCVFNVVFNNRDDHAKNFSFRMARDGQWKLAPAYDLTFNEGPRSEHQTDICGEGRAPARADLLRLAAEAGVSRKDAVGVIETFADVGERYKKMAEGFPIRAKTLGHMAARVDANRARMI